MTKMSSSSSSFQTSFPSFFVHLLFFAPLSYAFLPSFIPLARSQQPSPFSEPPIQIYVKGKTYISSWSRIAEFDFRSSSFHLIDVVDASASRRSEIYQERNDSYSHTSADNLVSARGWLEYCEARQTQIRRREPQQQRRNRFTRSNLEGEQYGGAYSVLRCDFLLDRRCWRIWGEDYHLNRLLKSYRSLLRQARFARGEQPEIEKDESNSKDEKEALESSLEVISLLLEEAMITILRKDNKNDIFSTKKEVESIITVTLTLLWDRDDKNFQINNNTEAGTTIRVQGHAFSTMEVLQLYNDSGVNDTKCKIVSVAPNPNTPVQAVIGQLPPTFLKDITIKNDCNRPAATYLPNRHQHFPQAKLSSWCRRRRLLEDIFKTKDIGEVILTNHCDDENTSEIQRPQFSSALVRSQSTTEELTIELLEGLTTNLFVVYPGNILRTAPSTHVLGGYVRQLVIDCAEKCGYKIEFSSITLADSSLWKQVFLTSSIRLIVPVNRIFLPNADDVDINEPFELETLWELPNDKERKLSCRPEQDASNLLYMELIEHATLYGFESLSMQKKSTD